MKAIERLLVATDFSPCADAAAQVAAQLAEQLGATICVMTMVDTTAARDAPGDAATRQLRVEALCGVAQQQLRGFADRYFAASDTVRCEVVDSGVDVNPCADIVRTAAQSDCDLIVLGTHGRSGLDHFLIGSVAEKVVRTSPIPTLVVRGAT